MSILFLKGSRSQWFIASYLRRVQNPNVCPLLICLISAPNIKPRISEKLKEKLEAEIENHTRIKSNKKEATPPDTEETIQLSGNARRLSGQEFLKKWKFIKCSLRERRTTFSDNFATSREG